MQYSPHPYGHSWGVFQELSPWGCGCVYIHVPHEVSSARLTRTLRLGHDIWIEALVDLVEGLVFPVSRHFRCGVDFVEMISPLPVRRERWMKGLATHSALCVQSPRRIPALGLTQRFSSQHPEQIPSQSSFFSSGPFEFVETSSCKSKQMRHQKS